jgi:hypothetical protein
MEDRRYRSLFWPILLITVGLVWFLGNINVIPNFNPLSLLNLWPLLLIALGLDLIIGRRSPLFGLLIGLATVAAAVAILIAAPNLGFNLGMTDTNQYLTERFTEPVGNATSATIEIHASSQPTNIRALNDSANLFEGEIGHAGKVSFEASGDTQKRISLRHTSGINIGFMNFPPSNLRWDIGLNPKVPLALTYDGSSGSSDLDLSGLQLESLAIDGSSGSYTITLPFSSKAYSVNYKGASGSMSMALPEDTSLTVRLHGGSGSMDLSLPGNAAVQLEVNDNGSGSIGVGGRMTRISGKSSDDKGTWETNGYSSAANKILIIVENMGSGSISIH